MAIVNSISYQELLRIRKVELLHPERPVSRNHETTLITGRNGSHKSSLLRHLVTALVAPPEPDLFSTKLETDASQKHQQVFCLSGSTADRFPSKELPGGRHSPFDVPNYTYVGQRVANNLLSRKAPLERMLEFALQPQMSERCAWAFFVDAHTYAGIFPSATYSLVARNSVAERRQMHQDLRAKLRSITPESDYASNTKRQFPYVSFAMAQWILKEFSDKDFIALEGAIGENRRWDVTLSVDGARCKEVPPNALRLGMHLDIVRLQDVKVRSLRYGEDFSALELSSGEYHMFSTILAIGFGLVESSMLLLDEPENSLHPQWQRELMSSIFGACAQVMKKGHVVISTHSPLIVGSALEGSTVVDMTEAEPLLSLVPYGASSDELLLNQFGVGSSRNRLVVDKVQQAVALVEKGNFDHPEFLALIPELESIRAALTPQDPMVDIIDALLGQEASI